MKAFDNVVDANKYIEELERRLSSERKGPSLTVDAVVIRQNSILLVKRKKQPFQDYWALPGGFVEYGEETADACLRELEEETNLKGCNPHLLEVRSGKYRDPRGHIVSIIYSVDAPDGEPKGADDAKEARFWALEALPPLAFDHDNAITSMLTYLHWSHSK